MGELKGAIFLGLSVVVRGGGGAAAAVVV